MMSGCVVEDYKVTINEEECKIMGLSNSSLQCRFVPTVHPLSSKLTIEVSCCYTILPHEIRRGLAITGGGDIRRKLHWCYKP